MKVTITTSLVISVLLSIPFLIILTIPRLVPDILPSIQEETRLEETKLEEFLVKELDSRTKDLEERTEILIGHLMGTEFLLREEIRQLKQVKVTSDSLPLSPQRPDWSK